MDETTLGRTLRAMGYRKLSARPRHHAQDPEAVAAFKKTFPASSRPLKMYGPPPVCKRFRFDGLKRSASMYPAFVRDRRSLATMGSRAPWSS